MALNKEQQQLLCKAKTAYSVPEKLVLNLCRLASIKVVMNLIDNEVQEELFHVYRASFVHLRSQQWQVI